MEGNWEEKTPQAGTLVFFLTPIYLQWINNLGKWHQYQGVSTSVPAVVETQGLHTFQVDMFM